MPAEAIMMGLGLGMDAMSVSAAIGVRWNGPRQKFRLAWHMALAQFLMPCAGFALGKPLASVFASYGKFAAAALVAGLGVKMLFEALESHPGVVAEKVEDAEERLMARMGRDPTRGLSLMALSLATSLDAMIVGFSIGIKHQDKFTWSHLAYDAMIIGLIACLMVLIGINIGQRVGKTFGKRAEIAGAVVLIAIAVSFVIL